MLFAVPRSSHSLVSRTPIRGQFLGSTKTTIRQTFRSRNPYNSSRSRLSTTTAHPNGNMENRLEEQQQRGQEKDDTASSSRFNTLQEIIQSGGWDKCWDLGVTPWDLGKPTPVLKHLHRTGALPKGRALIPGCGTGYDVIAIACPERYVVGADISEQAIKKAKEFSSSLPNADYFAFLQADFFNWHPTELFDLIFDYTFFCAIEPDMRSAWASQMRDLLKPDGELLTLMFPITDHDGGPPFKVSVAAYEEVLHPVGFEAVSIVDNKLAVGNRKGIEKLGRWKKLGRSFM